MVNPSLESTERILTRCRVALSLEISVLPWDRTIVFDPPNLFELLTDSHFWDLLCVVVCYVLDVNRSVAGEHGILRREPVQLLQFALDGGQRAVDLAFL